jgi:hypothetical protein
MSQLDSNIGLGVRIHGSDHFLSANLGHFEKIVHCIVLRLLYYAAIHG